MDTTQPPGLTIGQIYLAQSRFEHTVNPTEFAPATPIGDLLTNVQVQAGLDTEERRGFISVTVSTDPSSGGMYRFLVQMVALVDTSAEENMPLRDYLRGAGVPMLYPFIRETVATITSKGRFGPVWLPPMNFSDLAQSLKFADEQGVGSESSSVEKNEAPRRET